MLATITSSLVTNIKSIIPIGLEGRRDPLGGLGLGGQRNPLGGLYMKISEQTNLLFFQSRESRDLSPDGEGCDDGHALAGLKLGD